MSSDLANSSENWYLLIHKVSL